MDQYMQQWNVTFLLVHLMALYAFGKLFGRAPDWKQQFVIAGFIVAMLVMSISCAMAINGNGAAWWVFLIGLVLEHLSVLIYAFRLCYREFLCLPNGLTPSRRSSR